MFCASRWVGEKKKEDEWTAKAERKMAEFLTVCEKYMYGCILTSVMVTCSRLHTGKLCNWGTPLHMTDNRKFEHVHEFIQKGGKHQYPFFSSWDHTTNNNSSHFLISIVPYLTNKGQHTTLYKINQNIYSHNILHPPHPHTWTHRRNVISGGGGGGGE